MSQSTWINYGYGINANDIKLDKEKVVEFINMIIEKSASKRVEDWFITFKKENSEEEIEDMDVLDILESFADYVNEFEGAYSGLAFLIKDAIEGINDVDVLVCPDCTDNFYVLFQALYPWEEVRDGTRNICHESEVHDLFWEYTKMLTDDEIDIDYQAAENFG